MSDDYTFPGVYIEEVPREIPDITGVATATTAFIGQAQQGPENQPVTISSFREFKDRFGGLWLKSYLGFAVRDFFLNGGYQAIIVRLIHKRPALSINKKLIERIEDRLSAIRANFAAAPLTLNDFIGPGKEEAQKGLYALEQADLFNLLYIPPYKSDGNVDSELMAAAAAYCEKRRAFLIVDSPSQWQTTRDAEDGIAHIGTNSKNAALFFPRIKQPNPLQLNCLQTFPPGGAIAGVFARIGGQQGVWKAPAGSAAVISGAAQTYPALSDSDSNKLNPYAINCLRLILGSVIIWGARTLAREDSEWKYIPVRRMALFLEESISRGILWAVFEPNDEALWANLRMKVASFLLGLWRQGAFQGRTPRESFFVKCGRDITTQAEIDQGLVNVWVGFAPLKPAEFVMVKLQQKAGQPLS